MFDSAHGAGRQEETLWSPESCMFVFFSRKFSSHFHMYIHIQKYFIGPYGSIG